jgi:hypothetical protein
VHRVAASSADAQRADALGVDAGQRRHRIDGAPDGLDTRGRILKVARLAAAFALPRSVERKRSRSTRRHPAGVDRANLLLTLLPGVARTSAA